MQNKYNVVIGNGDVTTDPVGYPPPPPGGVVPIFVVLQLPFSHVAKHPFLNMSAWTTKNLVFEFQLENPPFSCFQRIFFWRIILLFWLNA